MEVIDLRFGPMPPVPIQEKLNRLSPLFVVVDSTLTRMSMGFAQLLLWITDHNRLTSLANLIFTPFGAEIRYLDQHLLPVVRLQLLNLTLRRFCCSPA